MRASLKLGAAQHFEVNQATAKSKSFTRQCTCEIVTSSPFWNSGFYVKAGFPF
jgi:hypothetical protein